MADSVTYCIAAAIALRDDGAVLTDFAVECPSAEAAINCAEQMSRVPGYVGAWAFSRSGDPGTGWYEDAKVLRRFGGL